MRVSPHMFFSLKKKKQKKQPHSTEMQGQQCKWAYHKGCNYLETNKHPDRSWLNTENRFCLLSTHRSFYSPTFKANQIAGTASFSCYCLIKERNASPGIRKTNSKISYQ